MSSKKGKFANESLTATPPYITYTDPVNCQWDGCIQQLSCIADLVQHIKKTHIFNGIKKRVCLWRKCTRNKKPFTDQYALVKHLRTHTGGKLYRCPYPCCRKILSTSYYLKLHIQKHNGETPYICQIQGCNKSFVNSAEHSQHQKTHSKHKPFACTFPGCDKRYKNQSSLNKHITGNHTQGKKPSIEELDNSLLVQSLQNNRKAPIKNHYTHHDKGHHQYSEVKAQTPPPLIAAPPEHHPSHTQTDKGYLQLPSPVFVIGLPDINTIFDAQDLVNNLPDNSHYYTDLQSQSYSFYQSPQLADFSQHTYNPKSLDISSLSPMTSSTNVLSHPQSTYQQCIPNRLPPYEDIQYMNYKSPLTTTQQPIMSQQQDYFAIPTLSMSN